MAIFYTDKDADIDTIANPEILIAQDPSMKRAFEAMARLKQRTDDVAKPGIGTPIPRAGWAGTGFKVEARFPNERALIALLAKEPDLLKDASALRRIIKKYPIYAAYTGANV